MRCNFNRFAVLAAGLAIAACTTGPAPTEVTRFHLGTPIPKDSIMLVPPAGTAAFGLEQQAYAAAVGNELAAAGFRPVINDPRSAYIGVLKVTQEVRPGLPKPSPFRIGIGGGTGGYSGGVGGGVSLPVGGSRTGDVRVNEVSLQIKRRSDETMIWEGRATNAAPADVPASNLATAVPGLAKALMANFPGASGQTVQVKSPK
ncbi:hypothetical protein GCM10011529_24220 [Polymorphobacter glacialis]|uniref:DUF4136 domain-containing protein n=1 Tax=Sandarakinorhabdus glacialis TaxID=1614636 RepID=A0A916ZWD6_9SPHN|nr:DUF4136 domain-containing protein [Polymorphobacter glacialis]GGE16926.1 hypothetical protein GCM10011529_24220 [Polymorphobacter glacialis]